MPATGGVAALQENLVAIGWGKQSAWGTGVSATNWWRWLDGTDTPEEAPVQVEREGDTSPFESLVYKTGSRGGPKIVTYARPRTLGCALSALLGNGSDSYTGPTYSSTLAADVAVGASSVSLTADAGNTGTKALDFTPGVASATYEVATIDCTTRSGTGPYLYTLAASAAFKNAHTSGDAVTSVSQHVFTRQTGVYDPYSIEASYGTSPTAPYDTIRYIDAVCYDLELAYASRQPLKVSHGWYSGKFQRRNATSTPTLEGSGQVGQAGAPFMWHQANGAWTVDGSSGNNAAHVVGMSLRLRNSTNAEAFIDEGVNPSYFTMDNFEVEAQLEVIFTSFDQYYEMYFGNTKSPASTASDSYLAGEGSLSVTFTADAVNALTISIPHGNYTAARKPTPRLANQPMKQQIVLRGTKSLSVSNPLTITLTNSQNSQY